MDGFCPRLVDYVVIVGSLSTNRYGRSIQAPIILNRFPPCDHEDFVLPLDVALFCQPEGCSNGVVPRSSREKSRRSPTSFVFTLTDKESGKIRYGISLNFLRPIHRTESWRQDEGQLANSAPHQDSSGLTEYRDLSRAEQVYPSDVERKSSPHSSVYTHTLTSLCIVTHHPFFAKFRWLLDFLQLVIQKCHEKSLGKSVNDETVWGALTGAVRSVESPLILRCVREIETWILRLLSAPAPIPGQTCLHLHVQPKSLMKPLLFAMPDKSRLPLTDFPVHLPIQLLGIARTLRILVCLLLEQKVVLQSADYNKLSLCVLAFTALLYPLQYMFPIIPLLPPCMPDAEQLLIAPTPFIIGIPASFYAARKIFRMPKDVWLANLDTQELSYPEVLEEIPDIPEMECNNLVRQLHCILEALEAAKGQSGSGSPSVSASSSQIVGYNPINYVTDEATASVALRVSMVTFLNSRNILGSLPEHTRTLRLYPRPVVAFQFESFMKSRPKLCLFTSMLARTQAVEYFAESSLCAKNEAYQRIAAGEYSHSAIGDHPQWFADTLPSIFHDVWLDSTVGWDKRSSGISDFAAHPLFNATVLVRLHAEIAKESNSEPSRKKRSNVAPDELSDGPTDESGSDTETEVSTASLCSTISDVASDHVDSGIGDSVHKSSTVIPELPTTPNNHDDHAADSVLIHPGQPLPACLSVHFDPPSKPVRPPSPLPGLKAEPAPVELPQVEPIADEQPVQQETRSASSAEVSRSSASFSFKGLFGIPDRSDDTASNKSSVEGESDWTSFFRSGNWFSSNHARFAEFNGFDPVKDNKKRSDDERYLVQVTQAIKSGATPGIFSRNRISNLLNWENHRNLVLSRLLPSNTTMSTDFAQQQLEDVPIRTWNQYKALVWILRKLTAGLESSMHADIFIPTSTNPYPNPNITCTVLGTESAGGFSSAFGLLEIAHTHYFPLPTRKLDRLRPGRDSSPRSSISSVSYNSDTPSQVASTEQDRSTRDDSRAESPAIQSDPQESTHLNVPNSNDQRRKPVKIVRRDRTTSGLAAVSAPVSPEQGSSRNSKLLDPSPLPDVSHQNAEESAVQPKSSRTLGYRYHCSQLVRTMSIDPLDLTQKRHSFGDVSRGQLQRRNSFHLPRRVKTGRTYVFEDLVSGMDVRSKLWDDMQFWEDAFLDAVSQERDMLGMDFQPTDLLARYFSANPVKRKHAELEEDRLLAGLMHNLTAFMVMTEVDRMGIKRKIRRLLAKSHMGLHYSQEIGNLLDSLDLLSGNDIDLKPVRSRSISQQTYEVYRGTDDTGELSFIEVCDDFLLVRSLAGYVIDRWWYDQLINISYRLHSHVLCISLRAEKQSNLHLFYTKKCQQLYQEIRQAMERVSKQSHPVPVGIDLGGQVNVIDDESGLCGTVKVCANGFIFNFPDEKVTLDIQHIKRCSVPQQDLFSIVYYDRENRIVRTRMFRTDMAPNLLYNFHVLIASISASQSRAHSCSSDSSSMS